MKKTQTRTPAAPPRAERQASEPRSKTITAWTWVVASLVAVTGYSVAAPLGSTLYGLPVLGSLGIALLQSTPVLIAIARPWIAIATAALGLFLFGQLAVPIDGAPWPWSVAALVLQCAMFIVLGLREHWRTGAIAWGISVLLLLLLTFETPGADAAIGVLNLTIVAPLLALVLAVSLLVAQRQRIRAQLFHERAVSASEQSRREVVEDRNRIARELHDVVAHSMSVIQVQATSAPYRMPQLDEGTRAEFAEIAASARLAMREMRQLLGVLRSEETAAETVPQPGIGELDDLLASVRRAGVPASLKRSDALASSGIVSITIYRIVQEALSNVVRHALSAETAVRVVRKGSAILVEVENKAPAPGSAQGSPGGGPISAGGHGLIGIRERVALLGGSANIGATDAGGYLVRVVLPDAAPAAPILPNEFSSSPGDSPDREVRP